MPHISFIYSRPVFPAHFIGRTQEVDRILSQLANPARGSSAISGDPRVGKTSLLHYLRQPQVGETWGLLPSWCSFLYLDCHSIAPFTEATFWRHMLRELRRHLPGDETLGQSVQQLLEQPNLDTYDLNSLFDDIARAGRLVVLLLDEFEGAVEQLDQRSPELLYHLRALLNRPERGLALVVASRRPLTQLCAGFHFYGSPFDNAFSPITLPPFSEAEVDALLDRAQVNFSPAERTYLRQVAGAHPYLVQLTASLIVRARHDHPPAEAPPSQIEPELERETEGYFSDLLDHSGETAKMLLTWLALAPLSQHLPAGRARLNDLPRGLGRYDQNLADLVKRGLVLPDPPGPRLFSPLFRTWVLRQIVLTRGQTLLSDWQAGYTNFLSPVQIETLQELVDEISRQPAVIRTPEVLAQLSARDKDDLPPAGTGAQVLGRYVIEVLIKRGSMADIFKAHDPRLGRPVAIKKLRTILAETEEAHMRFQREAQAIAALRHPHIVQIHDFDIENGHYYMVMEFIEGRNLEAHLQTLQAVGQTLSWTETLRITAQVAEALDYAHQHGMIHRDVKPANILLADDGGVFLTDFSLVRLLGQASLTQAGRLIGTFAYMAPEQIRAGGKELDYRADIYALGCVIYEMMTGQPPFKPADLPMVHLNTEPSSPRLIVPALPEVASQVILKALAKDPAGRPLSALQFIQDLRRALSVQHSIRLQGPIPLPDEQAAVVKQLYAESHQPRISRVHISQRLHGGLSGTHVILAQPIDDRGRGLAHEVVKIGPAAMLYREYDRYSRFVKGRLPMTAVNLERGPVQLDTLACLSYGFANDQPFGQVQDLETYYQSHSADEVAETLARLMKPLDARWYGQTEPLLTSFNEEYGRDLPPQLSLLAERLALRADFTPGPYRPIDLDTILAAEELLPIGERVAIRNLEINRIKSETELKLRSAGDGPAVWIQAKVTSPYLGLQEGDRVTVWGIVETRQGDVLHAAARQALSLSPAIAVQPDGSLKLEGLDKPYPDPLRLYRSVLKRQLIGRRAIIHGDLHPGNILVDESGRGWLIDFDYVREGHVLFDFIRLETLLRLFILGELRHFLATRVTSLAAPRHVSWSRPFSLAEYAAFEATLLQHTLGQPVQPLVQPNLDKAAAVILAIRRLAQPYLRSPNDWSEYLTGLFLHNLVQLKFYPDHPYMGILPLTTATVLGQAVSQLP